MAPRPKSNLAEGLIPPRPNLGPEPWSDPEVRGTWLVLVSMVGLALLGVLGWRRWRARRRKPEPAGLEDATAGPERADHSPTSRLIAASGAVREALVNAYGSAWASKTTEELAREAILVERLGIDRAARLVELFRIGDRAKFGGEAPGAVEDWQDWADQFLADWSTGPHSRMNGN